MLLVSLVVVGGSTSRVVEAGAVSVSAVGGGRGRGRRGGRKVCRATRAAHVLRLRLRGLLLAVLPPGLEFGLEAQPVPVVDAGRVGHHSESRPKRVIPDYRDGQCSQGVFFSSTTITTLIHHLLDSQ